MGPKGCMHFSKLMSLKKKYSFCTQLIRAAKFWDLIDQKAVPLACLEFKSFNSSSFSKMSISCLDSFVLFSKA